MTTSASSTTSSSSTISSPSSSTLAFSLTNVYQSFSFKLSVDGSKYKLWRHIFMDICKSTKVVGHITGDSKPNGDNDEDWESVDSRVKTWFYNTVESSLLQHITAETCTAKDLWDNLEAFFTNNKMSRALQLQETFRNTKKGSMSITDYCHTLKNLADALHDVDSPVKETELVLQILRNLPSSYQSIIDVITNKNPFPSFVDARNMLLLHESREIYSESPNNPILNSSTALYTTTIRNDNGKGKNNKNKNRGSNKGAPKGGGNNSGFAGSFGVTGNTGVSQHQSTQQQQIQQLQQLLQQLQQGQTLSAPTHFSSPARPQGAFIAGPSVPTMYQQQPSAFGYQPQLAFGQQQQPQASPYGQHTVPSFGGYTISPQPTFGYQTQQQPQLTDLSSVFSAMSLQQPPQDPNHYMDTGASSHMQFNSGS